MNNKIWKFCRYLVAVALVLEALTNIIADGITLAGDTLTFFEFPEFVSYLTNIMIAVAIIASTKTPLMIGCGIKGLVSVLPILYYRMSIFSPSTINFLATAVCYVLIAVSLSQKKSQEKIIPIAIIVGIVGASLYYFLLYTYNTYNPYKLRFLGNNISSCIMTYVYLLIGILALEEKNVPIADKKFISASAKNPIETITKLKELLDVGAISQEEFDEKKKKLLNL